MTENSEPELSAQNPPNGGTSPLAQPSGHQGVLPKPSKSSNVRCVFATYAIKLPGRLYSSSLM